MAHLRVNARVRIEVFLDRYALDNSALDARLKKRLDPRTQPLAATPHASVQDIDNELAKNQTRRQELSRNRADISVEDYNAQYQELSVDRAQLQAALDSKGLQSNKPQSLQIAGNAVSFAFDVIPLTLSVQRNGIREADTCNVTLNFIDVPIDPRIVKFASVEVVLGAVNDKEWRMGMRGKKRSVIDSNNEIQGQDMLMSIVPAGDEVALANPSTKFYGLIDDWNVNWDGDNGDTVQLQARDITGILMDKELPQGAGLDMSLPIATGVQKLIDDFCIVRNLPVVYGLGTKDKGLGPIPASLTPGIHKTRRGKKSKRHKQADANMSLWDHVTDVCVQLGIVPVVQGYTIRLIEPRTLYQQGQRIPIMVWGQSLESLEITRKILGNQRTGVEVRSYDPARGRTIWARYPVPKGGKSYGVFGIDSPPEPRRVTHTGISGQFTDEKITVYTVKGITDPVTLGKTAESIFQEQSRQELEGSFETSEISTSDEPARSGNLLIAQAGDPIEILFKPNTDSQASFNTTQTIASMSVEERTRYMIKRGFVPEVAAAIARNQDLSGFQTIFRVKNVNLDFEADGGLSVKVDFINYISVQVDGDKQEEGQVDPSPGVAKIVGNREDTGAKSLRDASSARRKQLEQLEQGTVPQKDFESNYGRLIANEREQYLIERGG